MRKGAAMRLVVSLLVVASLAVGFTAVSVTHDAVTGTEEVAEAWAPWPGFDKDCLIAAVGFGLTLVTPLHTVTTAISAIGSFLLRVGPWAAGAATVYSCRDQLRYFYTPGNSKCAFGGTAYNYPNAAFVPSWAKNYHCGWLTPDPGTVGSGGGGGGGGWW